MIFASLIATLIARYTGASGTPAGDETPPHDDARPGITPDRNRC